jgi:hypothetical protein
MNIWTVLDNVYYLGFFKKRSFGKCRRSTHTRICAVNDKAEVAEVHNFVHREFSEGRFGVKE